MTKTYDPSKAVKPQWAELEVGDVLAGVPRVLNNSVTSAVSREHTNYQPSKRWKCAVADAETFTVTRLE